MSTTPSKNYWLFQASPKVFRLKSALRLGVLKTFAVTSHKDKIKAGDGVILWQSGKHSACYGLATVVAPPEKRDPDIQEIPFFLQDPGAAPRVILSIDYNLWNQPLDKELLAEQSILKNLKAGLPGTNFIADQMQYEALESLIVTQNMVNEPGVSYRTDISEDYPLNQILFGPPGTGKTYRSIDHALAIIEGRSIEELELEDRKAIRQRYSDLSEQQRIGFVTFHQSFSYEDFVEGIKPVSREGQLSYHIEKGIFRQISERAMKAFIEFAYQSVPDSDFELDEQHLPYALPELPAYLTEQCPRYVLIIDEINRGNVPSIFGELITLLEADKRIGNPESITLELPYSKELFSIPPNLYLIATMNTTDRSVEVLDIALRRRFAFKAMPVRPDLIPRLNQPMAAGIELDRMLTAINDRIELLLGRDYAIGHAYFLEVNELEGLKTIFTNHVIPLLEEYFFNDYGKIGLVLGGDFVTTRHFPTGSDAFASFDHPYAGEFAERKVYVLKDLSSLSEAAFIRIYEKGYSG